MAVCFGGRTYFQNQTRAEVFPPGRRRLNQGLQSDGTYYLTSAQAKNILQLRLQTLTGLEHERIEKDYAELAEEIHQLVTLLNNRDLMQQKIAADLREVQESYGDARRSEIVADAKDFKTKDLIPLREMVVTMTDTGYIKSQASAEYRAQKEAVRAEKATEVKEGDIISKLFVATTHDVLLCFTDKGRMFWLNVWDLPEGSSNSKGRPIVNLLELNDEKSFRGSSDFRRGLPKRLVCIYGNSQRYSQEDADQRFQESEKGRHYRRQPC